jgi:hypothetical protein
VTQHSTEAGRTLQLACAAAQDVPWNSRKQPARGDEARNRTDPLQQHRRGKDRDRERQGEYTRWALANNLS